MRNKHQTGSKYLTSTSCSFSKTCFWKHFRWELGRILVHIWTFGETPRPCDDEDVVMMWWWRCSPLRPQKYLPANVPQSLCRDLKKTMIIQLNWKVGPSMAPRLNWFQSFLSFLQPDGSCDYLLPVRVMLNMFIRSSGGAVLHWCPYSGYILGVHVLLYTVNRCDINVLIGCMRATRSHKALKV